MLTLRGYSVALLTRALSSYLAGFAHTHFVLYVHDNFKKKSVSHLTQNCLKRLEILPFVM